MNTLLNDIRYSARILLKRPGFTLVAVITLALGIGANTAIFSVVNAVLLRPLRFKNPDRLVTVWESNLKQGQDHGAVGGANFTDWRNQNQAFETLAAYFNWNYNLKGGMSRSDCGQCLSLASSFKPSASKPKLVAR